MQRFKEFFKDFLSESVDYKYPTGKGASPFVMADFYMLNYMRTTDVDLIAQHGSNSGAVRIHDMNEDILYAEEQILPKLKKELLNDVFFALCAEYRHVFETTDEGWEVYYSKSENTRRKLNDDHHFHNLYYKAAEGKLKKVFDPEGDVVERETFKGSNTDYVVSYTIIKNILKNSDYTTSEVVKIFERAFGGLEWESNYGGEPWVNIARGWLRLNRAKNKDELYVGIDHVYDLQHNTDSVFNKIDRYYDAVEGFGWIGDALDLKANMLSFQELIPHLSGSMKKLARPFLQFVGDGVDDGSIYQERKEGLRDAVIEFFESSQNKKSGDTVNDFSFFVYGDRTTKDKHYIGVTVLDEDYRKGVSIISITSVFIEDEKVDSEKSENITIKVIENSPNVVVNYEDGKVDEEYPLDTPNLIEEIIF